MIGEIPEPRDLNGKKKVIRAKSREQVGESARIM